MEIKLANGKTVLIDDEDFEKLSGFQWKAHPQGYVSMEFLMHRFLMHPVPPGYVVHHRNGNKLDNRRENLELMLKKTHNILSSKQLVAHQKSIQKYPDQKRCVVCGAEFIVNPRKRKRNKTCSPPCALKMRIDGRKRQVASFPPSHSRSSRPSRKSKEGKHD